MKNSIDFYLKQLSPLVGGTITGLVRTGPGDGAQADELYGLSITLPDGGKRTLILLSDDEGNGPGSFEICK
ncbi:MAG: hypothetical protein EPN79_11950 [Burkholderiaceae bacterium]|nr:MAG: hypothetical protein EPN79_11950 [Burkholderiaceae bacterium]TBR76863.1 MAG: hypothetical protein EPN64_06480 [Burkholderiaceae bacterium]